MDYPLHVFLTGDKQVGKSTVITRIVDSLRKARVLGDLAGFRTMFECPDCDERNAYIGRACEPILFDKAHLIGTCSRKQITQRFPEVFETIGTEILESARTKGSNKLAVMDEIGSMERDAKGFSNLVLSMLDSNTVPVLGVIKKRCDTELCNAIRNHQNVRIIEVTESNREEVFHTLLNHFKKEVNKRTDSAGIVIFRPFKREEGASREVLMIRAGSRWTFPKGHMESGESHLDTSLRETFEETGIHARITDEDPYIIPSMKSGDKRNVYFYRGEYVDGEPKPQAGEVAQVNWVSEEKAASLVTYAKDLEMFLALRARN